MQLQAGALAVSIAGLGRLDVDRGADKTLQQVVDAARTLLAADGAGVMLVDDQGALRWATASDSSTRVVEAGQERYAQGPCAQAFAERAPVAVDDVIGHQRWQDIVRAMTKEGLRAALSVPVDIKNSTVGTLDVYSRGPRVWDQSEIAATQTYAGLTATLLTNVVAARTQGRIARQLERALANRVEIEQAKGVLMQRDRLSSYEAFERIRKRARASRRTAVDVAREILGTTQTPVS